MQTNKTSLPPQSADTQRQRIPIAMTIAGSDSGGGAGIQADLKTFSARGVYGASTITALTAQNTCSVSAIHEVAPEFVTQQLVAVLSDLKVDAIKIGMLASIPIIEAIGVVLDQYPDIPVVLDPVMVAKSGDSLLHSDAIEALRDILFPRATLITPNIPEAAMLLGDVEASSEAQMEAQARALSRFGCSAVLLKGGHLASSDSTDLLLQDGAIHRFCYPRIPTSNTHGTGCTLSSAITAEIAKGLPLHTAIAIAEQYIHEAIACADQLDVGHGHGPVHHFHALWS
ncbi:bifunctional hydroxymethylpyrimidine kinase/phosphomethylpyrimidine kinase [Granulosicoccus antarcticus]|uniref:hydroxymethylpyrimidine kinase n=1 Tax=Granulosicoccus antarcticus IMCC3135 TaxID=1192854 RepID=A0A2Z2NVI8_9GAMM|nr:bifunctional hydroxymethylpyrimidine kinase/phosphomethylpyrimidine kinase [Granulosicoccus antarcticus]ASJ74051.1 Hydroxymethylpyrimidine/phosphomethylpyrimidine kinase [Granulosicoccus antarcticus IMCC3135]